MLKMARSSFWRAGAAAALALAMAGCGAQTVGVLVPQASSPEAHAVEMLVATTRMEENREPGVIFNGERARGVRFADIAVSIPPDEVRAIGDVQWPQRLPADPKREFATLRADVLDLKNALTRFNLRVKRAPDRRVLVFVHGYNTRFEEAVYRFAQIIHDSKAPAVPVLFTWPSRGRLLAYGYDRESAGYSRDALENLLQALVDDKNVGEIAVLAHSMGNWTTLEALRQMAIRRGKLPAKIKDVMLAAPDVDVDVFRRQIAEIGIAPSPFTLFVSRDDEALAVSRRVWGDSQRLGAIDPNADPYKTDLARARVNPIDLTDAKSSDRANHSKFAASPSVVQAIGRRLASGQALHDGHGGIGEKLGGIATGAASTIGSAAGLVVSAPFSVIDARARAGLGDRMDEVSANFDATVRSATSAARPQ